MRVVMLLHKSVEHDARVRREAKALQGDGHQVVVVHLPRPGSKPREAAGEGYAIRSASPGARGSQLPGPLRRARAAARIARVARRLRADVIHAHDAAMLAPGRLAARGGSAMLVYDSHELATGVPYRSPAWAAVVAGVERVVVPRCDAVITVSDGIAERLQQRYDLGERPRVVRNVPDLPLAEPGRAPDLRTALGVAAGTPIVIHHGALAVDRGGETLVRSLPHLERARLLFLGAEGGYVPRIEGVASQLGVSDRVHFRPPVPLGELLSYSAQADVGVSLLQDSCENHRLALPNKVFEYIAAGLPVVVSDLPELRRLIERYRVGWCADPADPVAVAAALREAIAAGGEADLHKRLLQAARELSWERERLRLLELYGELGRRAVRAP